MVSVSKQRQSGHCDHWLPPLQENGENWSDDGRHGVTIAV